MTRIITCIFLLIVFHSSVVFAGECKQYVELLSARKVASEMGTSESYILANHRINLWSKTSKEGRFPISGKMIPGSRALVLDVSGDDYKVKSPLDGSTGWINKVQVSHLLWQDTITREACKP